MTDEEHRQHIESARRRLREIAEMTDEDPPGAFEQFMRNLDEGRPHRPLFKGMYGAKEVSTMEPETIATPDGPLPESALGPDGKFIPMTDEERKAWCEAARRRLAEIAQMSDEVGEPPDAMEQMMRGIDEGRPHRPLFKGMY